MRRFIGRTGSSAARPRGMGKAVALRLADEGADRDRGRRQWRGRGLPRPRKSADNLWHCNATHRRSGLGCEAVCGGRRQRGKAPHVLINVAAIVPFSSNGMNSLSMNGVASCASISTDSILCAGPLRNDARRRLWPNRQFQLELDLCGHAQHWPHYVASERRRTHVYTRARDRTPVPIKLPPIRSARGSSIRGRAANPRTRTPFELSKCCKPSKVARSEGRGAGSCVSRSRRRPIGSRARHSTSTPAWSAGRPIQE